MASAAGSGGSPPPPDGKPPGGEKEKDIEKEKEPQRDAREARRIFREQSRFPSTDEPAGPEEAFMDRGGRLTLPVSNTRGLCHVFTLRAPRDPQEPRVEVQPPTVSGPLYREAYRIHQSFSDAFNNLSAEFPNDVQVRVSVEVTNSSSEEENRRKQREDTEKWEKEKGYPSVFTGVCLAELETVLNSKKEDWAVYADRYITAKKSAENEDKSKPNCCHWPLEKVFYQRYVCILTNTPIVNKEGFIKFWNGASYGVLADGGANEFEELLQDPKYNNLLKKRVPDLLVGDFDSIRPEILERYRALKDDLSPKIWENTSTDFTDLDKALAAVKSELSSHTENPWRARIIYCWNENGGRVDHNFGNIHSLITFQPRFPNRPIFLVSSVSLTTILGPAQHQISFPRRLPGQDRKPALGIIPLHGPTSLRMGNFAYNTNYLDQDRQISTSNEADDESKPVTIDNSSDGEKPLLFTVEIEIWKIKPKEVSNPDPKYAEGEVGFRVRNPLPTYESIEIEAYEEEEREEAERRSLQGAQ